MRSLTDISSLLRTRMASNGMTQLALSAAAGITRRTLALVLSGSHDFKLTTLLAIADRLGLELVLVPKGAAAGWPCAAPEQPQVRSLIELGQQRLITPKSQDET